MDKNGAKTKDLWIRQDCKDLNEINYRQQGLADKISKEHPTVLTKRVKDMFIFEKELGWIYV
jgi:hypothetical protein